MTLPNRSVLSFTLYILGTLPRGAVYLANTEITNWWSAKTAPVRRNFSAHLQAPLYCQRDRPWRHRRHADQLELRAPGNGTFMRTGAQAAKILD